jgi:hypothetical protein
MWTLRVSPCVHACASGVLPSSGPLLSTGQPSSRCSCDAVSRRPPGRLSTVARRPSPCMSRAIRKLRDSVEVRLDLGIRSPWTARGSSCPLPAQKPHADLAAVPPFPSVRGRGNCREGNPGWSSSALPMWT